MSIAEQGQTSPAASLFEAIEAIRQCVMEKGITIHVIFYRDGTVRCDASGYDGAVANGNICLVVYRTLEQIKKRERKRLRRG
jgi:hypothetical protein